LTMIKTILLVEDDFLNRRLAKKILTGQGYEVAEAKNEQEALASLEAGTIDMAILDINLGEQELGGISIGRRMQHSGIPFLYLTAYDVNDIVAKAVATAPQAYLTKPFKEVDLLTSVQLAFQKFTEAGQTRASMRVKEGDYFVDIYLDDIDYLEAGGNYLLCHAQNKVYRNRSSVKQIMETLPAAMFVQTHRAFIVNKAKIEKFNLKSLIVRDTVIPVSKNFVHNINLIQQR